MRSTDRGTVRVARTRTSRTPGRLERISVFPFRIGIALHRAFVSPLLVALGAQCRFHPSCSRYADGAIRRYGWRGVPMAAWRVVRCHPWNEGGIDPVPEREA